MLFDGDGFVYCFTLPFYLYAPHALVGLWLASNDDVPGTTVQEDAWVIDKGVAPKDTKFESWGRLECKLDAVSVAREAVGHEINESSANHGTVRNIGIGAVAYICNFHQQLSVQFIPIPEHMNIGNFHILNLQIFLHGGNNPSRRVDIRLPICE